MPAQMLSQAEESFTAPVLVLSSLGTDEGPFARTLAHHAVQALVDEAELTPKPALVDRRGSGAHYDLNLALLLRSARSLEPHLYQIAQAAYLHPADCELRQRLGFLGREAERTMMAVTGDVNTHRGAIWALGLLVAAASQQHDLCAESICRRAAILAALPDAGVKEQMTNGTQVAQKFGAGGARSEAAAGFPHALHIGFPALRNARRSGLSESDARLEALLAIMSTLDDTCLLHRGGLKALHTAQGGAARVLALGGPASPKGILALRQLHESLMALWASPGGSADMLAATLFLDRLSAMQERRL